MFELIMSVLEWVWALIISGTGKTPVGVGIILGTLVAAGTWGWLWWAYVTDAPVLDGGVVVSLLGIVIPICAFALSTGAGLLLYFLWVAYQYFPEFIGGLLLCVGGTQVTRYAFRRYKLSKELSRAQGDK